VARPKQVQGQSLAAKWGPTLMLSGWRPALRSGSWRVAQANCKCKCKCNCNCKFNCEQSSPQTVSHAHHSLLSKGRSMETLSNGRPQLGLLLQFGLLILKIKCHTHTLGQLNAWAGRFLKLACFLARSRSLARSSWCVACTAMHRLELPRQSLAAVYWQASQPPAC